MMSNIHHTALIHPTAIIRKGAKIEANVVIEQGCIIGEDSIIGTGAVLKARTLIGHNTIFGTLSVSEGDNSIGNHCTIHAQCHITKYMEIKDRVFIAPFFCQANTPELVQGLEVNYGRPQSHPHEALEGYIGEGVVIGVGVTVAPGVRIDDYSKIDMRCHVAKDVEAYSHMRAGKEIVAKRIGNTRDLETWKT